MVLPFFCLNSANDVKIMYFLMSNKDCSALSTMYLMTLCRICAGLFMPLVKIDFVSAINVLMEGKAIAYYRIKMP